MEQSAGGIRSNVIINTYGGIYLRGTHGYGVYNNTILVTDSLNENTCYGIKIDENEVITGDFSEKDSIINNIIQLTNNDDQNGIIFDQHAVDSLCGGRNNVIYVDAGSLYKFVDVKNNNINNSYFNSSYNTNLNLTLINLTSPSGSDADDNGADLGEDYNNILLDTSIWPDAIVIDTQDALWDIGAYKIE